ncbi:MAG: hypothetical protein P1V21_11545 [Rhizobiaceae bacterium]|nr:hypothetical protein [Rhizobiaceae bacterium]
MTHSLLAVAHGLQIKQPDYANLKVEEEYYSRNQNALLDLGFSWEWRVCVRTIVSPLRSAGGVFPGMQPR